MFETIYSIASFAVQDVYMLRSVVPLTERPIRSDRQANNSLQVAAWFKSGRFFRRREYLLYDYNAMVADVGGYLGERFDLVLSHRLIILKIK